MKKLLTLLIFSVSMSTHAALVCLPNTIPVNGCSDAHFNDINPNTNFSGACDNHDRCYSKIGRTKSSCDDQFENELAQTCINNFCVDPVPILDPTNPFPGPFPFLAINFVDLTCPFPSLPLPSLPQCLITAQLYVEVVRNHPTPQTRYNDRQIDTLDWARGLAQGYDDGLCFLLPSNANVFQGGTVDVANALYQLTLNANPTQDQLNEVLTLASNNPSFWQYDLINDLDGRFNSAWLVPVISLLLL